MLGTTRDSDTTGRPTPTRARTRWHGNRRSDPLVGDFNLAWEIDVCGRIRRATESARADYAAAQAFRRRVLLTLVSAVGQAYFERLELDRELEIAHLSTETFERTLALFTRQYEGGVGTRLAWAWFERRARPNLITHFLGRLPDKKPRRHDVELPKRQTAHGYRDPDHPCKSVPETF